MSRDISDSEGGDAWYSMVRTLHLAGRESPYHRPPVDRMEGLLAREVNAYAFRTQVGYGSGASTDILHFVPTCDRCGSKVGPHKVVGAWYTRAGRIDRYRCADGCPDGTGQDTGREAGTGNGETGASA